MAKETDKDIELLRSQIWDEATSVDYNPLDVMDMLDELEAMGEDPFSIL